MIKARLGQKAPLLDVSDWVQGGAVNFDQPGGNVTLVEVFQVNCPGCFLYALPQAIDFHQRYASQGLTVIGIATAFEDFDKNTLENLQKLVEKGEVIGETHHSLSQHDLLESGRLPYRIPFPLGMDKLVKRDSAVNETDILDFIKEHLPDFDRQPDSYRNTIISQVRTYLEKLKYRPQTFERYNLKGTPSHILVDKQGILRVCGFGNHPELEDQIRQLLQE